MNFNDSESQPKLSGILKPHKGKPAPALEGYMDIHISDIVLPAIPSDPPGKQMLACFHNETKDLYAGLFFRYCQPDWPNGRFWWIYRIECARFENGIWIEYPALSWDIYKQNEMIGRLNSSEVDIKVVWNGNSITTYNLGDPANSQTMTIDRHLHFVKDVQYGANIYNGNWGSPAIPTLLKYKATKREKN